MSSHRIMVLLLGGIVAGLALAPAGADGATWTARYGVGTFTSSNGTTPDTASWSCTMNLPRSYCFIPRSNNWQSSGRWRRATAA
jgi:hypothetical protein